MNTTPNKLLLLGLWTVIIIHPKALTVLGSDLSKDLGVKFMVDKISRKKIFILFENDVKVRRIPFEINKSECATLVIVFL